jgi:cell division protease FtsH
MADFEMAKDKVMMGTERKSMVMSETERNIAAWHEAGHTVVGMLVEGNDAVHKVSIIPRGAALGVTMFLPVEDRHLMTRTQALARISMMLGGRVAEEVVFGEITTGAQDDIKRATALARSMVCEHGMTDVLGPLAYGDQDENIFLGREMASRRDDYSDDTARQIDKELRRIIDEQYMLAKKTLEDNRESLNRVAEALLERETLSSAEIRAAIKGEPLPEPAKVLLPRWSDKRKEGAEKKRAASIFGAPKPAPSA